MPRLIPTWEKCYLDLGGSAFRFEPRPLPLGAVYVLRERRDDSSAPQADALAAREGLVALVANTSTNYLLDSGMRREFAFLGTLVDSVPVRQVTPHASTSFLPDLCRVILNDFHRLPAPGQTEGRYAAC